MVLQAFFLCISLAFSPHFYFHFVYCTQRILQKEELCAIE